ncbi:fasciclin domain-containing protein [Prevotella sp. E2-28]|uniref:fasciclin domain-containing protein n=1 Tax=Prevotella sp. E2-28 TaxID=2913620 RepID=UPI001EDBFEAA|nr:fasciclin domain-containing protein [Prevotella sp. E2-28]UKK54263.1 fasciclin domain-containing protein [Prevotella sp. E2-28]
MKKLFLYASLLCLGLGSCTKDYVVPEGELPSWLGESIYKELQQHSQLEGTFNTYCRLIDDLGYKEVLSKTGSKTIFPANDEAFERFFAGGNNKFGASSYEELTHSQKAELLFSTMLDNAILVGTLSNKQNAAGNMLQGQLVKHGTNMRLSYAVTPFYAKDMPANNKYFSRFQTGERNSMLAVFDNTVAPMVHFTGEYMLNNNMTITGSESDFKVLTGHEYSDGDAYIFDRKVIKSDVVCQNGYIHQLDEVLVNPGNMAEILRAGDDTKYISRMLDYYAFPEADMTLTEQYNESESANQDTVFAIRYLSKNSQRAKLAQPVRGMTVADNQLLDFDPGWNYYNPTLKGGSSDDDAEIAAFLAPDDKAVEEYFLKEAAYILKNLGVPSLDITAANLNAHLDAVYNNDPSIFSSILNNVMKPYLTKTVPSTFSTVQNDAFEFLDVTKNDINLKGDGNYDVTIANNGVIYKMNKLFGPKLYNSVLGPASVYKDMRTMGEMLNDHQATAGVASKLGADMYYYLLSMKARYGIFVPTDNETQFIVIDPTSVKDDDGLKGLRFRFDPTADGSFHVLVKKYIYQSGPYNELSSYVEAAGAQDINIETGIFNSQIKDLLDYCTVVLADSTETGKGSPKYGLYGNKFYKTKHGGAIIVNGNKVAGGLQASDASQWSTITETFDANSADAKIENGTVYRLDYPIQPTITSVMKTLTRSEFYDENADYDAAAPEYDHFLNFCLQFNNEDLYTFAGIISESDKEAQKNTKMKAYRIIDDNDNWGMLSAYNYTIYAPTYEAMVKAQQTMGLPKWKDVLAIVENWESVKDQYGFTTQADAAAYVKAQLDKMTRFVRYHTQNSSLFADRYFKNFDPTTGLTTPEPSFSTFCSNSLGIAQTLTVTGGNNKLSVKDAAGKVVTVNASSNMANLIARDITTTEKNDGTYGKYKTIETSAFVTVHGIETPLCYNSNGKY